MTAEDEDEDIVEREGGMLLYTITIKCYLSKDGEELDAMRILNAQGDDLPAYKQVLGSLAMSQETLFSHYNSGDDD